MPILALTALLSWPLVAGVLFSRLDRQRAMIWTLFAGYLLLPMLVAIDLPAFPGLDKSVIPSLAAAALVLVVIVFVLGLLRGENWIEMFRVSVAMAVAAVPDQGYAEVERAHAVLAGSGPA